MFSKIWMFLLVASIFGFIPSLTSFDVYFNNEPFWSRDVMNICECKNLTKINFGYSSPYPTMNVMDICKCEDLTHVHVTNSSTKLLPSRILDNCHSLENLFLPNNEIMEITHDTFNGLSNLSALDLSSNHITALPKGVFNGLSNLFTLNLSRNRITTLPKNLFNDLTNLAFLDLSRNRIEMIDSHLFFHNQRLYHLYISDNNLTTIEPKSFRMLENLFNLKMCNNPSLNSTDFLYEGRFSQSHIDMQNCGFTQLFIPMNVTTINAEGNKINNITAHPNTKLESLIISRNNFTNLSRLSPLVNLRSLNIENNGISHIDFTHFSHMNNLWELFIELNPKQNISIAEITESLPSLRRLHIVSSDLSGEIQKQILNDSIPQFEILINGKEYSIDRQKINQKNKIPSKMIKCLRKMN